MFEVFLRRLEFYGYHGVSVEERLLGHRYIANITLLVDGSAEKTDRVADTVDYGEVAARTLEVARTQCHTVERLARLIGDDLLVFFPLAQEVRVEVSKLGPPMPAIVAEAGVTLTVRRE